MVNDVCVCVIICLNGPTYIKHLWITFLFIYDIHIILWWWEKKIKSGSDNDNSGDDDDDDDDGSKTG